MSRRSGGGPTYKVQELDVELLLDSRHVTSGDWGGVRMRVVILIGCLLITPQLVGCSPSSEGRQPGKNDDHHLARPANADLLSADGELFPLKHLLRRMPAARSCP